MSSRTLIPVEFVRLALRRLLPRGFWVPVVLCFVLALLPERPGVSVLGPEESQALRAALAAARGRQAVWSVLLFLAGPLLIAHAARSARHWSKVDADWFAPLPVPRGRWATLTSVGIAAAVLAVCLCTGMLAELRAGSPANPLRFIGTLDHPSLSLVAGDSPTRWMPGDTLLANAPAGSLLIARPTVAPGSGPGVTVRFSAQRGAENATRREARIFGRSKLELDLPRPGDQALELQLERLGPGAVCVLPPRSIDLFEPVRSARLASAALFVRSLLTLGAWALLAAGLGAWMRPYLATLLTLGLGTLPWCLSPERQLFDAWQLVGAGYVPPGPTAGGFLGAGCISAVGYWLLRRGTARGRTLS